MNFISPVMQYTLDVTNCFMKALCDVQVLHDHNAVFSKCMAHKNDIMKKTNKHNKFSIYVFNDFMKDHLF